MSCSEIRQRLAEFVYGDLTRAEVRDIEAHLHGCRACQREHAALAGVRTMLDRAQATSTSLDLPGIYHRLADLQTRRARLWRRTGFVALGAAAAVLLLTIALQLEIRADARQVVIRWGTPPVQPKEGAPVSAEVGSAGALARSGQIQTELQVLNELVQGLREQQQSLTDQQQARDERVARDRAALRAELDELRRQTLLHWMATERDVAALCSAQLTHTQTGGSQ
jgi:Putative zinc-finger